MKGVAKDLVQPPEIISTQIRSTHSLQPHVKNGSGEREIDSQKYPLLNSISRTKLVIPKQINQIRQDGSVERTKALRTTGQSSVSNNELKMATSEDGLSLKPKVNSKFVLDKRLSSQLSPKMRTNNAKLENIVYATTKPI